MIPFLRRSVAALALCAAIASPAASAPGLTSAASRCAPVADLGRTQDHDLAAIGVDELHRLYARGSLTVVEVVTWHLRRIEALNPRYKPLVRVYAARALERAAQQDCRGRPAGARGLLWGVPVVVKDNSAIAGLPLTNGWAGYALPASPLVARRDATVVERLEAAGAIILAHSNMPDFAASDTNVSSIGGRTGNAYAVDRSPGGSSGGTAVAVSLGMAVIGQGTDTGNSIRNPAANAGLVGVLPTRGLVSIAGIHPMDWLRDNTGPMARTVTDAAIALQAMAGTDPHDPETRDRQRPVPKDLRAALRPDALKGRRFGVPRFVLEGSPTLRPMPNYWNRGTSPDTRALFMAAVAELRAAGATVVIADDLMPETFDALAKGVKTAPYRVQAVDAFLGRYAAPPFGSIAQYESVTGQAYGWKKLTDDVAQAGFSPGSPAWRDHRRDIAALRDAYAAVLRAHRLDGLVYPALQVPPTDESEPLPAGFPSDGPYSATSWVNLVGAPAVVVPAGQYADGMPFGIEIAGPRWADATVLGFAYAYEQATRHRRAPVADTKAAPAK